MSTVATDSDHAYRSPTVLLAPGILFRAGQGLTTASLLVVAALAVGWLWSRLSFDMCIADRGLYACALETPRLTMSDLGVPLAWQESWLDVPAFVPAALLMADVLAVFWLIRPRTARLDPLARTLTLHHRRWPRRATVSHVRLDDILHLYVESKTVMHAVGLVDVEGRHHEVTGFRLGRRRQERLAAAIEGAIERGV